MVSARGALSTIDPPDGRVEDRAGAGGPGGGRTPPQRSSTSSPARPRVSRAAIVALLSGLLLTAALSLTALALYDHNETRLLRLRARELSLVLGAVVPEVQTPLASAAALADETDGNAQKFRQFMAPFAGQGRTFASASLWLLGTPKAAPTTVLGTPPLLASRPALAQSFFAREAHLPGLSVLGILHARTPSLGYAFSAPVLHGRGYAVYAESALPANRQSQTANTSGFNDLNYAVYLGHSRNQADLVVTNIRRFPIRGRQASATVPFGSSALTIVVTPRESLGGAFFESLPWIIALLGAAVSLAAAALTERLVRGRRYAEELAADLDRIAGENQRMYTEQHGIAQTLQHALLPDALPQLDGLRARARYVPAGGGIDVGGDWYDIHPLDDQRALLVIGDVSGHGLPAATAMASLRHAALAYAAEGLRPAAVLEKLSMFVGGGPHAHFATVLVALIERDAHSVTVASAGHLPPLIVDQDGARFLPFPVGPPVGVGVQARYQEERTEVRPRSVLITYTDGLVERRGELIDVGLERLRGVVETEQGHPLDQLLEKLTDELTPGNNQDDTAIVGIEWED